MGKKGSKKKGKSSRRGEAQGVMPTPQRHTQEKKGVVDRKWFLLLAVVGVIASVSYLNCFNNQFVFDDIPLIAGNPSIRGIEKIPRLLLGIKTGRASYRPVRTISYAVDFNLNSKLWQYFGRYETEGFTLTHYIGPFAYHVSNPARYMELDPGFHPLGYHISNLAYHLITTLLVFLVIYGLAANYRVAFLAAGLFALHPVHTDSVTYLSGRRDILFTLFYMAGFYFFLRYRKTNRFRFIIFSFLAYLLSIGSKEMGVTLPVIFLCYDLVENYPAKVRNINATYFKELFLTFKKVLVQSKYLYSPILLGAFLFSYYKIFVSSPSFRSTYYGDSMLTTFLTVGKILVHYMTLLVYPINLNADYSYNAFPLSSSLFEPATFCSFIVLSMVGYVILRLLVHHKVLAFGGIWFFVTLLPVCHIFSHHELLAEHYLYLPSVGYCLIAAFLLNSLFRGGRYGYVIYASFIVVGLLFSLRIVDRNRDWKDELSLWQKTIKTAPRCARAHHNLGRIYAKNERLDEAISEYEHSLTINPRFAKAHYNLGLLYAKKGRLDKVISEYKQALALNPRHAKAHTNLGLAYVKKGRLDEAISEYMKALAIEPDLVEAHANLGAAYAKKGMLDEAISQYNKGLAIRGNYAWIHNKLAAAYFKKEQYQLAIKHCDRAVKLGFKVGDKLLKDLQPYR